MKTGGWWKLSSLALVAVLAGCGPKMTMEDMKRMRPQRPAVLDKLDAFVGTWKTDGTVEMIGMSDPLQISGTSKMEWQGDKWYLVENSEFRMADMEPSKSIAIWGYDDGHSNFRAFMIENVGSLGSMTLKYNERKNVWKAKACATGAMGSMSGVGTMRFLDANTMEWHWKDYARWDIFHLVKIMEFRGTSKRQ